MSLWRYLAKLSPGLILLWCYFIWYLVVLVRYFRPDWHLWLTSVGASVIVGIALLVNTTRSGKTPVKLEHWPMFRLFVTPLCVSSFSALISGKNFVLIFSPYPRELLVGLVLILLFCATVALAKKTWRDPPNSNLS